MKTLPRVLEDPEQLAPLAERIAAASELGADDPRLGTFQRIPAGTFRMGSDAPEGSLPEQPQVCVSTGSYEIATVPVTVCEFAAFVERGYGERALWSDDGWAWRTAPASDRPRFWGEDAWREYLGPNHPVVGVSWFEAEAYARFAEARLPTEVESERAARGEDGRRYPWGDPWFPENAAHRGGPRHTLPVGCFPAGRSPHGLLDAAGNVWEWTSDRYDLDAQRLRAGLPRLHREGPLLRSARGGSWNAHPPQLRCAHRNAWFPDARFSNIGFRLAR